MIGGHLSFANPDALPSATAALKDQAYAKLLRALRSGEIMPGAEVTEGVLAARLSVTKAPLRSAMARLCQEGWLEPQPRRGHRVRPLTVADTLDLFAARKMVEPASAQIAAGRVDEPLLRKLDQACRRGFTVGDETSECLFFEANKMFHLGIMEAAGNRRLYAVVSALHDEAERVLRFGMRHFNWSHDWAHGHADLLTALVEGDGRAARDTALRQLEHSESVVIDALRRQNDRMDVSLVL